MYILYVWVRSTHEANKVKRKKKDNLLRAVVIIKKKENNFVVFERCEPIDSTREDK